MVTAAARLVSRLFGRKVSDQQRAQNRETAKNILYRGVGDKKLVSGTLPLGPSPVGVVGGAGRVAGTVFSKAKQGFQAAQNFANLPLKARAIGAAKTLGVGLAAFNLAQYAGSGDPADLIPSPRGVAGLASATLNPFLSVPGFVSGASSAAISKSKDFIDNLGNNPIDPAIPFVNYTPNLPNFPGELNLPSPTTIFNFPESGFSSLPDVPGISAAYSPSFQPSLSVGNPGFGGIGLEELALLLGIPVAALLGYKIGKKKKKKKPKRKKYKRRKR